MPLALSRTGVVFKKCYINNVACFQWLARRSPRASWPPPALRPTSNPS